MTITWTTDKPTVPGWYWYRYYSSLTCMPKVAITVMGKVETGCDYQSYTFTWLTGVDYEVEAKNVTELSGEWAGPIPEPEEPLTMGLQGKQLPPTLVEAREE